MCIGFVSHQVWTHPLLKLRTPGFKPNCSATSNYWTGPELHKGRTLFIAKRSVGRPPHRLREGQKPRCQPFPGDSTPSHEPSLLSLTVATVNHLISISLSVTQLPQVNNLSECALPQRSLISHLFLFILILKLSFDLV